MANDADVESLCKQARTAFRTGKYDRAIRLFQKVVDADPDRADAHDGLATSYFMSKQFDQAIEHFLLLTRLTPQEGKPFINLGAVYNQIGEYKKATDVLRRGIQREPKSQEAYYNLGIAHRKKKEFPMAINAYREAIRLKPEMAEAHQNLANVYVEMGNNKQAIEHYKTALAIRPDFARAQRGLKQAEEAAAAKKQQFNPFGRLVNEADYAAPGDDAPVESTRELSKAERFEDRHAIQAMTLDAVASTRELVHALQKQMEPALSSVNRAVGQGTDVGAAVFAAHEKYKEAVQRCAAIRERVKQTFDELYEHEKTMGSQDLKELD